MTGGRFVHGHQAQHAVKDLFRMIDLPRSTYYTWLNHQPGQRAWEDNALLGEIKEIHTLSRDTYGAPRILGQLCHRGHRDGRHRVARIMVEQDSSACTVERSGDAAGTDTACAPDLLERDFSATRPDEQWVADISEFHCLDGNLFLTGIRDLFDKTLVGWAMGERQTTDLAVSALVMALSLRRPDAELVHHSDKGPRYASLDMANLLSDWGFSARFGSTGDDYDNAAMESSWATAKREIEFLHGPVRKLAKSQLRTIIFEYVEVFYNGERHRAILSHLTLAEYYATATVAY